MTRMNRRELILGSGALGVGSGSSGEAQALPAAHPAAAKAGESASPYVPGEYGETLNIVFTTSTDLGRFMPPGLSVVDPHRAFIKAQRKKGGTSAGYAPGPRTSALQIGIATMASTAEFGPRQRNILMWVGVPWGVVSTLAGVKRWGDAEMSFMFEEDRRLVARGSPVPFFLDVQQYGNPVLSFAGILDGRKRVADPPYSGMYVGGEPGADLLALTFDESQMSRPLHGTGTLRFGALPFERAPAGPGKGWPSTLLEDIHVEGCIFQDMQFTRSYEHEFQTVRKALPTT